MPLDRLVAIAKKTMGSEWEYDDMLSPELDPAEVPDGIWVSYNDTLGEYTADGNHRIAGMLKWCETHDIDPATVEIDVWVSRNSPDFTAPRANVSEAPTLTDLERQILDYFGEENGAPSGLVAKNLGIPTAKVTSLARALAARGLLEDTGYAMKYDSRYHWQYIDRPKTEGGMISKPGASTVWKTTPAGHAALAN